MSSLLFARIRQGLSLTRKALGIVRSHPALVKLPIIGGILGLLAFAVFGLPAVLLLNADSLWPVVGGFALLLIGVYLAEFVVVYYQVALVVGADQVLRGEAPDIVSAKRLARKRLGPIAGWLVVSFLVGLVLGAVRERGGVLGRLSAAMGAAIWSLVAFLVLPILAFEGTGPVSALKRSTAMVRERWGQQITGNAVIGGVSGLIVLLGIVAVVGGVCLVIVGGAVAIALGVAVILVGVMVTIGGGVFGGATRSVFGVALYRFVVDNRALEPFTAADLAGVARPVTTRRL